jgi:hypothetical protein
MSLVGARDIHCEIIRQPLSLLLSMTHTTQSTIGRTGRAAHIVVRGIERCRIFRDDGDRDDPLSCEIVS